MELLFHCIAQLIIVRCNKSRRKPMTTHFSLAVAAAVLACTLGITSASAEDAKPLQKGVASWYGPGFHGKKTANGERFNTNALTAAHKTLPFGTQLRVTNERTGKSVVVRINDRGPYAHGRVIDLSKAAAEAVGISGVGKVTPAKFDGVWSVSLVADGGLCGSGTSSTLMVQNGSVRAGGAGVSVSGQVGPSGSVSLALQKSGVQGSASGRLSGASGSGSWSVSSPGCSGRWTARRA